MTILAERRVAIEPRRIAPLFCRGYCGCQGGADSLMCRNTPCCELCNAVDYVLQARNRPRLGLVAGKYALRPPRVSVLRPRVEDVPEPFVTERT